MTDIVERLRLAASYSRREWPEIGAVDEDLVDEAADEIARLRAALEPFAEMGRAMMGRRHHMEAVVQYALAPTIKVHHLTAACAALAGSPVAAEGGGDE